VVEIALLRGLTLFSPLAPPELEALARSLEPVDAAAGEAVVREGDPGDRFYAVADGQLAVTQEGRRLRLLGRGDVFGEIALLHEVPRTATVTPVRDARLYALEQEPFLAAVTGHPQSSRAAGALVSERLETLGA
jgi:CRP-like cAMP-binding protein